MVFLVLVLILFIASPFALAAVAAKSLVLLAFGLALGVCYVILFLLYGFSELVLELRAQAVSEALNLRLQKLWREAGPERTPARFWIYPESGAHFKVWIRGTQKLEIFFSQGLLNLTTDQGLKAAFTTMTSLNFYDIRLQNRRHALMNRLVRMKGPAERFRYWFLSFCLYPLERCLKIAKL